MAGGFGSCSISSLEVGKLLHLLVFASQTGSLGHAFLTVDDFFPSTLGMDKNWYCNSYVIEFLVRTNIKVTKKSNKFLSRLQP